METTTMQVYNSLTKGRGTAKEAAIRVIENKETAIDCDYLRHMVVDALKTKFISPKTNPKDEDIKHQDTRCWLLSALGRLSKGDKNALDTINDHLDESKEFYEWARYWALEGLTASNDPSLVSVAQEIANSDSSLVVQCLANAILARAGDAPSITFMRSRLNGNDDEKRAVLRALRFVPLLDNDIINMACKIVDDGGYADHTFDAIAALGKLPSVCQQAEKASQTLMNYLIKFRWPMHEAMRIKAIIGLGNLGFERTASVLIEELADDSPAIVGHAARALEKVLGTHGATKRIFDVAVGSGAEFTTRYGNALLSLDRDIVAEELERMMLTGAEDAQEVARTLLSEVGGVQAFQRLNARTRAASRYIDVLAKAEEKVQDLFEKSLREAQQGFRMATIMDLIVFAIGVVLLGVSAGLCLAREGSLTNWTGIALTGGMGVLGVLYGILISNPRRQIRESVDHLMYLKVVFLAYLRQLHQTDQAYTRRLLEDKSMLPGEVSEFSKMVATILSDSVLHLTRQNPPTSMTTTVTLAENGQVKTSPVPEPLN